MSTLTKKQIIKVAKLFDKASVLPILECVRFDKTRIIWDNLETSISLPFQSGIDSCVSTKAFISAIETFAKPVFKQSIDKSKITVEISEGKQRIKVVSEDAMNYPVWRIETMEKDNIKPIEVGTLSESSLPTLKNAVRFVSNDDLRPALTQIQLHKHIVSTDAHRLYFVKLPVALKCEILMNKIVAALLEILQGDWTITKYTNGYDLIVLENKDGVVISYRMEDGRYPDWQVIIPKITEKSPVAVVSVKELRDAIKIGSKFGNKTTKQMILTLDNKSKFSTGDLDFMTEYETDITPSFTHAMELRFNWDFMDEIISLSDTDTFTLNYFTPTKGSIINGQYLLMPLMMHN